jgi:hypothetical protein
VETTFINLAGDRLCAYTCLGYSLQTDSCGLFLATFAPTFIESMEWAYHQDPMRLDRDFCSAFGSHSGSFGFCTDQSLVLGYPPYSGS